MTRAIPLMIMTLKIQAHYTLFLIESLNSSNDSNNNYKYQPISKEDCLKFDSLASLNLRFSQPQLFLTVPPSRLLTLKFPDTVAVYKTNTIIFFKKK